VETYWIQVCIFQWSKKWLTSSFCRGRKSEERTGEEALPL
jgi:hypothetical protein